MLILYARYLPAGHSVSVPVIPVPIQPQPLTTSIRPSPTLIRVEMFSFCHTSHVHPPLHHGAFSSSPTTFQIETQGSLQKDVSWQLPRRQNHYLDNIDIHITSIRSSATSQCSNCNDRHTSLPPSLLPPSSSPDGSRLRSYDTHRVEEIRSAVAAVTRIIHREHIALTEEELIDKILDYILLDKRIDAAKSSDTSGSTSLSGLPKFTANERQLHKDCQQASQENNEYDGDSPKGTFIYPPSLLYYRTSIIPCFLFLLSELLHPIFNHSTLHHA